MKRPDEARIPSDNEELPKLANHIMSNQQIEGNSTVRTVSSGQDQQQQRDGSTQVIGRREFLATSAGAAVLGAAVIAGANQASAQDLVIPMPDWKTLNQTPTHSLGASIEPMWGVRVSTFHRNSWSEKFRWMCKRKRCWGLGDRKRSLKRDRCWTARRTM